MSNAACVHAARSFSRRARPSNPNPAAMSAYDPGSGTVGVPAGLTLTLSNPIYAAPAAPVSVIAVFGELAVNSSENGVQVEAVLDVDTVNVWLVSLAEARTDTGGPPHL